MNVFPCPLESAKANPLLPFRPFTNHIEFSFVVGFFYGVLCVDLIYSLNVMTKIRLFARENKIIIYLGEVQQNIRLKNEENKEKLHFWLTMKSEQIPLLEHLRENFKK